MNIDYEDIYKWVEQHTITRQKRNINRDFSDAVPLAEILKFHYPKIVEMHNYNPKNSFTQKLINWQMLNRKVLNKMKINLSTEIMENLANSVPGEIEKLLVKIKHKIETKSSISEDTSEIFHFDNLPSNSTEIVPIKVKSGDRITNRKVVPTAMFDKMQKDLEEKDDIITSLKGKIEHMENLISLKDQRINELNGQLQQLMNTPTREVGMVRSGFLNKLFNTAADS